jgi:hypothetical protein
MCRAIPAETLWQRLDGARSMSGVFKLVSIAGAALLIVLVILTIISISGGFHHPLSNPPV